MRAALADLHGRFVYRRDTNGDDWRLLVRPGRVYGDCEDFALTLLWLLCGRSVPRMFLSILTFRAMIWICTAPSGELHAILRYKGWWADNTMPDWYRTKDMPHRLKWPTPWSVILAKMLWGSIRRTWLSLRHLEAS